MDLDYPGVAAHAAPGFLLVIRVSFHYTEGVVHLRS